MKKRGPNMRIPVLVFISFPIIFLILPYFARPVPKASASPFKGCTPVRVGGNPSNAYYGAWWICEEEARTDGKQLLLSFGSGCDSTFEWDFASRFPGAEVHVFDPTIDEDKFLTCSDSSLDIVTGQQNETKPTITKKDRADFWPIGLSDVSRVAHFFKSENPKIQSRTELDKVKGYQSDSLAGLLLDLQTVWKMIRVDRPPILKMDIEGSELKVIPGWCNDDGFVSEFRPKEILIEFHHRLVDGSADMVKESIDCLNSLGYTLVHDNKDEEKLFVLTR